jgi:hypothetical protein
LGGESQEGGEDLEKRRIEGTEETAEKKTIMAE